jgi:hypothetical protein
LQKRETLPNLEEIQAVEDKIGSARSDLDMFLHTLKRIDGHKLSHEQLNAVMRAGGLDSVIETERPAPSAYDPETFTRLLVLAGDLQEDAESLGREAAELQQLLGLVYRFRVLEPCPGDELTRGGDDA